MIEVSVGKVGAVGVVRRGQARKRRKWSRQGREDKDWEESGLTL